MVGRLYTHEISLPTDRKAGSGEQQTKPVQKGEQKMYMEMDMSDRAYDIMSALEDKVNEIFTAEQEKKGIGSSDIAPMVDYDLITTLEKLAQIIDYALTEQEEK